MFWVADEEDALDGAGFCVGEGRQGVDCGRGALRVALKNEAFGWVRGKGCLDVVDYLRTY